MRATAGLLGVCAHSPVHVHLESRACQDWQPDTMAPEVRAAFEVLRVHGGLHQWNPQYVEDLAKAVVAAIRQSEPEITAT